MRIPTFFVFFPVALLSVGCTDTTRGPEIPTQTCSITRLESTRLLCRADQIRSERLRYSAVGAVGGAVVGAALVAADGGNPAGGAVAGAAVGALAGYWLNERNAIAAEKRSVSARARELNTRIDTAVRERRRVVRELRAEIQRARQLSDRETKIQTIQNIVAADSISRQDFRNTVDGATAIAPTLDVSPKGVKRPSRRDELPGAVVSEACDALVDIGENCRFIA